jgi:hypothetical protein
VIDVTERIPYYVTRNVDNRMRPVLPGNPPCADTVRRAKHQTQGLVSVEQMPRCANRKSTIGKT